MESLPGIGIKSAIKLMKKYHNIKNVLNLLKLTSKAFPCDYERRFWIAFYTFQHQTVYDCCASSLVALTPIADEDFLMALAGSLDFLGPRFDSDVAKNVCNGALHPITKVPIALHGVMSPKKLPAARLLPALPDPMTTPPLPFSASAVEKRILAENDENASNGVTSSAPKHLKTSFYFAKKVAVCRATTSEDLVLTPADSQTSLLDFFAKCP